MLYANRGAFGGLAALVAAGFAGLLSCTQDGTTVLPINLPPTPVITVDLTRGVVPLTVQFDSSGSTDDGFIVSRAWDFGDGASSQEIAPKHTFLLTGEFDVTLTLTDDEGATSTRTRTITVTDAPVPIISVDRTIAASAPATIVFDATASFDPDGEIVEYEWNFGDGSREFLDQVNHQYASPGSYRATLTVTDDNGVESEAEILISIGIRPPAIELLTPPPSVTNMVLSPNSPLWLQAETSVEAGVPFTVRGGLDADRDACDAQTALFDLNTGSIIRRFTGHDDEVLDATFSFDGSLVLTASVDGTIRLYQTGTGAVTSVLELGVPVTALAFAPNSQQFAYGLSTGQIFIRDIPADVIVRTYNSHSAAVTDIEFSHDGVLLLSASEDGRGLVWDVDTAAVLRDFDEGAPVNAIAISRSEPRTVATAGDNADISLWNYESGALVGTLSGHTAAVNDLAFSADGLALVSGSDDNSARVWSPFLGTEVVRLTGHTDAVTAVLFSPDAARVITGGEDGAARVWLGATGALQRTVQPCASTITSLSIADDGRQVLASIAAKNGIPLDTDPPNGNDLNVTYPQALVLHNVAALSNADVPEGQYFLWAEIDTDRTNAVRAYAGPTVQVVGDFDTDGITADTPILPYVNDTATVITDPDEVRQIFDLGPLNQGDRLFLSLASTPGFGASFELPNNVAGLAEFSIMILDANEDIFAWYQDDFVLFTQDAKLIVGHDSPHYYVVLDGGIGLNVRIERDTDLFAPRAQTVFLNFDGIASIAVGGLPVTSVSALDASDFNGYFSVNPNWGNNETETLKAAILNTIQSAYDGYNLQFVTSDAGVPSGPHQTMHIGGSSSSLYGIADYIDPRNDTLTGSGITFAVSIGAGTIENPGVFNPVDNLSELGAAIGRVAAHEIGHLLGLRHTADGTDIMQSGFDGVDSGDPTISRILKSAVVSQSEQVSFLPALGTQNAPVTLIETVGVEP